MDDFMAQDLSIDAVLSGPPSPQSVSLPTYPSHPISRPDFAPQLSVYAPVSPPIQVAKNLAPALATLSSGVQSTMSSLHSLQTAAINAQDERNSPHFHDLFTQIRLSLHREWQTIIQFLRRCYDFSDKATCLLNSRSTYSDEEFTHYIRELVALSCELLSISRVMQSLHHRITSEVARWAPHLTSFLKHSIKRAQFNITSQTFFEPENLSPTHMPEKPSTREFVQANLRAACPDRLAALQIVMEALHQTSIALSMLAQLWASFYDNHRCLVQGDCQPLNVTEDQPMLDGWAANENILLSTISHLEKMCDAITRGLLRCLCILGQLCGGKALLPVWTMEFLAAGAHSSALEGDHDEPAVPNDGNDIESKFRFALLEGFLALLDVERGDTSHGLRLDASRIQQ